MIVGEHYQEYISWSIDIAMRIQNLCEELNIQSLWKLKENLAIIWRNDWQRYDVLENDVEYIEDIIRDLVQIQI